MAGKLAGRTFARDTIGRFATTGGGAGGGSGGSGGAGGRSGSGGASEEVTPANVHRHVLPAHGRDAYRLPQGYSAADHRETAAEMRHEASFRERQSGAGDHHVAMLRGRAEMHDRAAQMLGSSASRTPGADRLARLMGMRARRG